MKNKKKERMERILRGSILFTTLLTLAFPVQAWAKVGGNETEYTYTVTLCSGNQGYFSDTNGITVDNHITGSSYQIEKESQRENSMMKRKRLWKKCRRRKVRPTSAV